MHVKNLGSNQTQITAGKDTLILVSYSTPVAAFIPGRGYIRTARRFSRTTSAHINKWLAGAKSETVDQAVLDNLLTTKEEQSR